MRFGRSSSLILDVRGEFTDAPRARFVRLALRNTWIKMDSGTIAVVSNSQLSSGPLINHTATGRLSRRYAIE